MIKKCAAVTLGVAATMVAVSPAAFAGEDPGSAGGQVCEFTGGAAGAGSDISGDTGLANAVAQAPTGGNNALNLLNCSNVLNDNLNGNHVNIADIPIF